jgi:2-aminoadipate transaminase
MLGMPAAGSRGGVMSTTHEQATWASSFASRAAGESDDGLASILATSTATGLISFSGGFPDPATFPGPVLAEILGELMERGDASALQYAPTPGLPGLREYLTDRLERLERRRPADDELLVTSGGIEALELLGKCFLEPGDTALVEAPTYLGAIMAFRSFEADVRGVPIDAGGLVVEELERTLSAGPRPKLLYVIPDHQNPGGVSLAADRREPLVELARRHGVLVVEDVAYRELGFTTERHPSLWELGPDTVVQIGTFSKTFFPGVRLGWAAGPPEVVAGMVWAKQNTDQCAGALGQRLLEEYGRRGLMEEQNERARALYRRRCELLMAALDEHLPEGVTWTRPEGGFFTWLTLPQGADAVQLAAGAREAAVAFVPGTPFHPDGRGRNNIRLAFSRVQDDEIPEGAARIGRLLRDELERVPR